MSLAFEIIPIFTLLICLYISIKNTMDSKDQIIEAEKGKIKWNKLKLLNNIKPSI
jgi:hypothetical protein